MVILAPDTFLLEAEELHEGKTKLSCKPPQEMNHLTPNFISMFNLKGTHFQTQSSGQAVRQDVWFAFF